MRRGVGSCTLSDLILVPLASLSVTVIIIRVYITQRVIVRKFEG